LIFAEPIDGPNQERKPPMLGISVKNS